MFRKDHTWAVEWEVENEKIKGKYEAREVIFIKGALAALSQNKVYPADIEAAISFLREALKSM